MVITQLHWNGERYISYVVCTAASRPQLVPEFFLDTTDLRTYTYQPPTLPWGTRVQESDAPSIRSDRLAMYNVAWVKRSVESSPYCRMFTLKSKQILSRSLIIVNNETLHPI